MHPRARSKRNHLARRRLGSASGPGRPSRPTPAPLTAYGARARRQPIQAARIPVPRTTQGAGLRLRARSWYASPWIQLRRREVPLAEAGGDADRFLPGDLSLEPIGDPARVPEERVPGEAQRVGLNVARGVAVEELMRLSREPVRGVAAAERHRLEGRTRPDSLPQDRSIEAAFELDD